MPATTRATRAMHDRIIHPECESDRHDGTGSCVCPTRRQKERDARGDGWIPKEDPQHEGRFTAMADVDREATRLEWALHDRDDLACRGEDPEMFFPLPASMRGVKLQEVSAKAVCRRCPALDDCLTVALAIGDDHAVMGGTTAGERRQMRKVMNGWAA